MGLSGRLEPSIVGRGGAAPPQRPPPLAGGSPRDRILPPPAPHGAVIRRVVPFLVVLALAAAAFAFWRAQPLPEAHALARAGRYYAPTDEVWAAVTDLSKHAEWRSDLATIERLEDVRGHEVWRETPRGGAPVTWETVETLPDRRLVRCVIDQGGPFGGCVTVELVRRDDGAIVTVSEKLKVHSARFRWTNTVAGRRDRLDTFLGDLGRKFGAAETRIADLPKDLRDPPKPAAGEGTPAADPVPDAAPPVPDAVPPAAGAAD